MSLRTTLFLLICAMVLLSFFLHSEARTEAAAQKSFADALEQLKTKHQLPGIAATAVVGDKVVEIGAAGVRKSGFPEPVTVQDQWHVGSCGKAMTATLAAILVESGTLRWETTVFDALPAFQKEMSPGWKQVTLEHLLQHQGGAPENPPPDLWERACAQKGSPTEQRREFVQALLRTAPESRPRERFQYSNQGYAIAGVIMEQFTGRAWEELMRERLFTPLGMVSAGFGAPGKAGAVDQPWGHTGAGKTLEPVEPGPAADNPPAVGPAGTIHCSIGDWARFCAFHARGAKENGALLKPESFRRLHRPTSGGTYALGWDVLKRHWAGGKVLTHSGSNTAWFATTWIVPGKSTAFVVATNAADGSAAEACDDAVALLIKRVMGIEP